MQSWNQTPRRSIMLTFPFVLYKHKIYRNAYNLRNMDKWKGIYLQDDLFPAKKLKNKEVRAIYEYAKAQGIKLKGSSLVIVSIKYGPKDTLPHNLLTENAKTVKVYTSCSWLMVRYLFQVLLTVSGALPDPT